MAFPRTFKNVQDAVIANVRLDATADLQNVKDWINQAYYRACLETEAFVTHGNITLTAGTATYDLSTFLTNAILRIKSITVTTGNVLYQPLQLVPLDQILQWRIGSGGASAIAGPTTHYALAGMNELELYPTPSAGTLTIYYVYGPAALSADADVPLIPEPHATEILEAGAMASAADFKADPYQSQYDADFQQAIMRFRVHLNRRRGGQPGTLEWAPGRQRPPHDPSTILPAGGW